MIEAPVMTEVERMARLLCRAHGRDPDEEIRHQTIVGTTICCAGWQLYGQLAEKLTAAGLTILPREPDEATVELRSQLP